MPRNIEIKARIPSVDSLAEKVVSLADQGPFEIDQDDTFFSCANGRLKLRAFSSEEGELIFYRRADQVGPKESFYVRAPTTTPNSLRDVLSLAHGQTGRVRKHRTLFLIGRTRVHLDRVMDLGHFLELEVVLEDHESAEVGVRVADDLLEQLGIQNSQLVREAYVDLLTANGS
jgi:predicted adenylyl cyclase CyaB